MEERRLLFLYARFCVDVGSEDLLEKKDCENVEI